MKDSPLVTIITPSYNQGSFIEATINSVLNQTYKNIEYIVIDAGSSDNTLEILNKYKDKIKYISEKDNGQADAINKGFKMANGQILGWINSDDMLSKDCVELIVDVFIKNQNLGIVYGNIINVDENGRQINITKNHDISLHKLLNVNSGVCQPGSFYRASFVKNIGYLDDTLRYVMDYELWVRLLRVSDIKYLNENLSYFRLHSNSKTVSEQDGFAPEIEKVLKNNGGTIYALPNTYLKHRYYNEWKEKLIPKLEKAFSSTRGKNVGIYGAGGHTIGMLELYKEIFGPIDFNIYIFDSDTNRVDKELLGYKIHSINSIQKYNLDRIIISSYSFQEEIFSKVEELKKKNTKIIKLYGQNDYIFFI